MEKNVGGIDRIARLIIGSLLIIAGIAGYAGFITVAVGPMPQALGAVVLFIIGAILLATGVTQKCTINKIVGINTYKPGSAEE